MISYGCTYVSGKARCSDGVLQLGRLPRLQHDLRPAGGGARPRLAPRLRDRGRPGHRHRPADCLHCARASTQAAAAGTGILPPIQISHSL